MKHIIWSNYEKNDDAAQEFWYDERVALKDCGKDLPMKILAIADLGLWDGRHQAYKIINNLEDVLYSECDYFELYCDQHQLRSRGAHHDGYNYVTYYLLNEAAGLDKFLDDLYYGKAISDARLHKYTRSLRPYLKQYYGW